MSQSKQVFEDFPTVDCNACERYYTNQCDGAHKGSEKPCKTFLAIRRVDIPDELKRLQGRCESLEEDIRVLQTLTVIEFIMILALAIWGFQL